MDPGPEGKLYADDYGLSLGSFSEAEPEDWLHGFQFVEDGKETGHGPPSTGCVCHAVAAMPASP